MKGTPPPPPTMSPCADDTLDGAAAWYGPSRGYTCFITFSICLIALLLFFRSVLPRIPRIFLRGRLRIRRIGLRGIRGLEWRSKGKFKRSGSEGSTADEAVEDDTVVRIQHIYPAFGWRPRAVTPASADGPPSKPAESARRARSWITIHVQGVGVRLARSPSGHEAQQRKIQRARAAVEKEEQDAREAQEAEDRRLDALVEAANAAGSAMSSRKPSLEGPADRRLPPSSIASPGISCDPSRDGGSAVFPLQLVYWWLRMRLLPAVRSTVVRVIRAGLFVVVSSLPALTSIIDIQVHRAEVYIQEAESVVRIDRIGANLSMAIVSGQGTGGRPATVEQAVGGQVGMGGARRWFSEALSSVGSSARGAASSVTAGLPAGRGCMHLRLEGVRIFEAQCDLPSVQGASTARSSDPASSSEWLRAAAWEAPPPTLSRKRSVATRGRAPRDPSSEATAERSEEDRVDWREKCLDWADWALEPSPASSFTADTGWTKGRRPLSGNTPSTVPASAVLLSLPSASELEVGLLFGPSLNFGGREAVDVRLGLAEANLDIDAIYRVLRIIEERKARRIGPMPTRRGIDGERSGVSKHVVEQRKAPPTQALAALRSASFTLPKISFGSRREPYSDAFAKTLSDASRQRLPHEVLVRGVLHGLHFSVSDSHPSEDKHRKWLGACGFKRYKRSAGHRSHSSNRSHSSVEHRRAFAIDAGFAGLEVSCRLNGEIASTELLHLGRLRLHSRSTWTPFGLLPRSSEGKVGAARYFLGDANEQVLLGEASVDGVRGDADIKCIAALLNVVELQALERRRLREKLRIDTSPKKPLQWLDHIPKLSLGLGVSGVSYRIRAHQLHALPSDRDACLMLKVPDISVVVHGSYRDAYIRRSDAERRAAWKALKNDELEWSISNDDFRQGPGMSSPRLPSVNFARLVGRVRDQLSAQRASSKPRSPETPTMSQSPPESPKLMSHPHTPPRMTIEEAVRQMKELQKREKEAAEDENCPIITQAAGQGASGSRIIKVPTRLTRRASSASREDCAVNYDYETFFQCPTVECFFVFSGADPSSESHNRANTDGADDRQHQLTRRQVLAINNFEVSADGTMSGLQDVITDKTSLHLSTHQTRAKGLLEELDIEMWHPLVLRFAKTAIAEIESARVPLCEQELSKSPPEEKDAIENETQAPPAIIDRLRSGLDLWFSIGGILAHIGGSDPNCDPHLCRGLGFEARRIVAEFACAQQDGLPRKADWGSRSALMLPEDVQMSANALASRHGKSAIAKLSLYELGLFPLLNVEEATQLVNEDLGGAHGTTGRTQSRPSPRDEGQAHAAFADAIWDFQERQPAFETQARRRYHQEDRSSNFIFWVPFSATKVTVRPAGAKSPQLGKHVEEVTVESEGTRLLALKVQLLHTYCVLVALSALRSLAPTRSHRQGNAAPQASKKKPAPLPPLFVDFGIIDVHLTLELPEEVRLFVHLRRLDIRWTVKEGPSVLWESLMGAVESPKKSESELWEEAIRLRDWKLMLDSQGGPDNKLKVSVNGDGASVRIPHGYVVHKIIDSASVAFKATKQLVHQFIKGGQGSVINPVPEDPKRLPHINVKVRILTFEAQDDPIETRLNIIWRAGGDENRARLEREAAFSNKVEELEALQQRPAGSKSRTSFSSRSSDSLYSGSNYSDEEPSIVDSIAHMEEIEDRIREARDRLDRYNSASWIRRYANARAEQGQREGAVLRRIFGKSPTYRQAVELPIRMAQPTRAAPIFRSSMTKVDISVGPTTFPEEHLRDWMHEQGKGTPKDLPYSLLVPLHLTLKMAEWRVELRDYPLPLFHVPPVRADKPDFGPAIELSGDLCVAEHLSDGGQSIRHVPAVVIPAATGHADATEYGINVPKVAMPVKLYGSPVIDIHSPYPTRFSWGQSMQPAIHDMTRVFDGITSPPHDPSPKVGFWDKLPLVLQSRLHLRWQGGGSLHLYLKGSRDPYQITGNGAGWVKCWRGNVEVRLGFENEDREFLQFISDEFLLAIPDLRDYQDKAATGVASSSPSTSEKRGSAESDPKEGTTLGSVPKRYTREPHFSKICIKLTNGVRWGASLRHEHTCTDGNCTREPKCQGENFYRECRFFDRRPHWTVIQRSKEYMDTLTPEQRTDSFYRWRSDFSHLGLSIYSPKNGLTAYGTHRGGAGGANNLYFSPLAWQHFWAWLHLFDSSMGLPIRQGSLFPNAPPPSPKFGRTLGTLKYRFDVAPLFISHLYPQYSQADWAKGSTTLLGIKARLGVFHMDMHQRQQEMIKERPELQESKKVFHKPFYEAEADFGDIDLRTLVGRFRDPSKRLLEYDDIGTEADENTDLLDSGEAMPDDIHDWVDINDFVEVDYTPNDDEPPEIRLTQALTCPRFNFYRRYDSQRERRAKAEAMPDMDQEGASALERTKFGREDPETHTCLIGQAPRAWGMQGQLAIQRLEELRAELKEAEAAEGTGPAKSSPVMDRANSSDNLVSDLRKRIKLIEDYCNMLDRGDNKEKELRENSHHLRSPRGDSDLENYRRELQEQTADGPQPGDHAADVPELYRDWDSFDDRFFFHNPTMFFTNQTRHTLLRYYTSSKRRKGFVHHMTTRAIWNIRQLSKHLEDQSAQRPKANRQSTSQSKTGNELLSGLLNDTMQYVISEADVEAEEAPTTHGLIDANLDPQEGISDEFKVRRSNICVFLKPQIVMKSQVNDSATVILTAIRVRLQNYAVLDPSIDDEDSVNRRVLSRNYFSLDGLQVFHPNPEGVHHQKVRGKAGQYFVPLETLIDLRQDTNDFDRIVSRTDASIRYDKFNRLRLHDSTRPVVADVDAQDPSIDHLRHYMDLLRVRCPRFGVSANSTHFAALYNIVTDLILYRSPVWREHAKQLETCLLSYDFKNTALLADLVADLQLRIRAALALDAEYQFHFDELNEQGRMDLLRIKAELSDLVDELLLIAEAITASEDAKGDEDKDKKSALRLEAHAQDLSWNMMGEKEGELLAKLSIKGPSFTWLNKADNSAANSLSIVDLSAVDVRPDAHFAEIISKWSKAPDHPMAQQGRFVNAVWSELAPVGGISIVDQFELDVHPLRLQLEIKTGRLIMDYIFGSKRHREQEEEKRKQVMEAEAKKEPAKSSHRSPFARLTGGLKSQTPKDKASETPASTEPSSRRTSTSSERPPVSRPKSSMSGVATPESRDSRRPSSAAGRDRIDSDSEDGEDHSQFAIAKRNAEEMRHRASSNLTFVFFKLPESVFCLSYKGEKDKSITDVYDLVFKAPNIEYRNRTWTYEELVQHIKKDVFRAAWGQKTTILKSILAHRPKRPEALRSIRDKQQMLLRKTSKDQTNTNGQQQQPQRSLSPLQLHIHPPSCPRDEPGGQEGGGREGLFGSLRGSTRSAVPALGAVLRPEDSSSIMTGSSVDQDSTSFDSAAESLEPSSYDDAEDEDDAAQYAERIMSRDAADATSRDKTHSDAAISAPAKISRFLQGRLTGTHGGSSDGISAGSSNRENHSQSRSSSSGPNHSPQYRKGSALGPKGSRANSMSASAASPMQSRSSSHSTSSSGAASGNLLTRTRSPSTMLESAPRRATSVRTNSTSSASATMPSFMRSRYLSPASAGQAGNGAVSEEGHTTPTRWPSTSPPGEEAYATPGGSPAGSGGSGLNWRSLSPSSRPLFLSGIGRRRSSVSSSLMHSSPNPSSTALALGSGGGGGGSLGLADGKTNAPPGFPVYGSRSPADEGSGNASSSMNVDNDDSTDASPSKASEQRSAGATTSFSRWTREHLPHLGRGDRERDRDRERTQSVGRRMLGGSGGNAAHAQEGVGSGSASVSASVGSDGHVAPQGERRHRASRSQAQQGHGHDWWTLPAGHGQHEEQRAPGPDANEEEKAMALLGEAWTPR